MENKITANKMALVRSRLANHDQAKSKSTSHRKANKVSGESKLDISNRIKNLKSVFINKEGEKSSLLDGDNSKRISTESEKCVISNGMLSLHLENKNEVIKPKPPPLAKPENQICRRKIKGFYGSTLQDCLDMRNAVFNEETILNESNAPTYQNYENTEPKSEAPANNMKRLSTSNSDEIHLTRDVTNKFTTTKLLDDSHLQSPIKKPSKLRLNRHDLYLQSYGINMAKPSKSLYGYLDEQQQQQKNPLPPLGSSFGQNNSFKVTKEASACNSSLKRDSLTPISKPTGSSLQNNCFTHTSYKKTVVNAEEKENCSDYDEDEFKKYPIKHKLEKNFYDHHKKNFNYKTFSPLPKTPTEQSNNFLQPPAFHQPSWNNFDNSWEEPWNSREDEERKQVLNFINEKVKQKSGWQTSNRIFNIESEGKLLQPMKHPSFVKKESRANILQQSLPHSSTVAKTKPRILPPLNSIKSKKRCYLCGKRTGLASSYTCRCGLNFCAQHRYAEAHNCTHDYKSQGRKVLQGNNPLVRAPKLPKI